MKVEKEPDSVSTDGYRRTAIRIAKWIIATAVAVGLFFAAKSATSQWRIQSQQLQTEIEQLDRQIERDDDPAQREDLVKRRRQLQASIPRLGNLRWTWLAVASVFYALALVPPGFLLHRALGTLGQSPRIGTAIAAQLIGHVGKYVPGKAMVVVLRSGALHRDGVRLVAATVSVFLETFLMMAVGGVVAGVVICWLPVPTWLTVTAVLVAVAASLPTLPPMLSVAAKRFSPAGPALSPGAARRLFLAGWVYSLVSWLLIGGSFTAVVYAIPATTPLPPLPVTYAISTAAISLAMVVGFGSLLPGGAGIRELVLTTVLGVALGPAHGLLAAIAARLIFIFVEACLGLAAWFWLRRR